ncbi:Armadillo-type fold [Rhodotorula toruloides]|uniref:Armadillo-type fold n=1 Tax=Rhodotorula toruloides TaxID=5286 RepID=A0A2T0AFV8_RHOTO|nr:Armadillo-type fold [Rhodotorula toruloides]
MANPPQSSDEVFQALAHALSPDQTHRQHSLDLLQRWATMPGYYSFLVSVFTQREGVPREIRLQAAVQFKNGLDKYWRRGAPNGISAEEKDSIRPRLLEMVDERDHVLAVAVASSIAKVAGYDYDQDWRVLPHALLSSLQTGLSHPDPATGRLVLARTLLFLHAVIKALSAKRMPRGRANMMRLAEMLFSSLRQLYEQVLQQAVQRLQAEGLAASESDVGAPEEIESAMLAFKTLQYLLLYGCTDSHMAAEARDFFTTSLSTFQSLLTLRLTLLQSSQTVSASPRLTFLTRHVIKFGKMYRTLLRDFPGRFADMGVSDRILELYYQIVLGAVADVRNNVSDDVTALYPTRLVVQALLLVKSLLGDWDGRAPLEPPEGFVEQFTDLLVKQLLPLRQDDLEKWQEDPEEWMNEEEMERWEFDLRPCAENVLKALASVQREKVGPILVQLLQSVANPQTMDELLLKEAVYTAVGRSPSELEPYIPFEDWLRNTLAAECAGTDPTYRIIRRRVAWLLGQWVGEDIAGSSRPQIYSLLVHLLGRNDSTDTAIRLTAARSLAKCDTWDFDRTVFVPLLPKAIEEIVQLLSEVSLTDSKMRLNETLGVVIDRLWQAADENHFQASVLVTFTKLAEALDAGSQVLQSQACPIIRYSVDPSQPAHVYLNEDGLELWQILLRRSSSLSAEMLSLLPILVTLLGTGMDILPRCLLVLESYLLLDATAVLSLCANGVFTAVHDLLDGLKLEAVKVILHALNTVFQLAPPATWAGPLDASGCFAAFVKAISANDHSALIVSKYLCSISRIILASPEAFHTLVAATASRLNATPDQILELVMTQFIERLDNLSQGAQRKLVALALAQLVATVNPVILGRMADLVSLWSSVLAQTEESESGDADLYHYEDYQSDVEQDWTETLETKRRQEMQRRDPIRASNLKMVIRQKLGEAQALNGGDEAFRQQWLDPSKVDSLLVEDLVNRLEGRLAG